MHPEEMEHALQSTRTTTVLWHSCHFGVDNVISMTYNVNILKTEKCFVNGETV